MNLLPIHQKLEDNTAFQHLPDDVTYLSMSVSYFGKIGYNPPWIGYYAEMDGQLVGNAAFKGQPVGGKVEIAYGTFEQFHGKASARKSVGNWCCWRSKLTLPSASWRTLPEPNYSTRILEKNNFRLLGIVDDLEDGEVGVGMGWVVFPSYFCSKINPHSCDRNGHLLDYFKGVEWGMGWFFGKWCSFRAESGVVAGI
ncbi:MAG: hypothetical protein IPM82_23240 [Saprospiraceae bacterium]|nr:hypothetical protein [Saprospiraceae bacterium]